MKSKEICKEELYDILNEYEISDLNEFNCIDTSHGENDIRLNYIIDKKYVIRLNSVNVMSEQRLKEFNKLILRYREFGFKAPLFLKNKRNRFVIQKNDYSCYVSE